VSHSGVYHSQFISIITNVMLLAFVRRLARGRFIRQLKLQLTKKCVTSQSSENLKRRSLKTSIANLVNRCE